MKASNTLDEVLDKLQKLANPEKIIFKEKKYGIIATKSLGIYMKDLKLLAKAIGKNDQLAIDLFESGIYEARLLCALLFNPKSITPKLIDQWIASFDTWEICDIYCMSFIGQSPYGYDKIFEYVKNLSLIHI